MDWTLKRNTTCPGRPGPLLLVVMDGVGLGRGDEGDAVGLARTPVLDRLLATSPNVRLRAHGRAVGMPSDKDMGNSEVGHNALGSGRVFDQGAKLVEQAIASGALFEGEVWRDAINRCGAGGALHFVGLLSDGNVHSHIAHLLAMIAHADEAGVASLYVHALLDGRDVDETSALAYVETLEEALAPIDSREGRRYRIASGGGRMVVTMDRYEADWSIVERGWNAHVLGEARHFSSATAAIEAYRSEQPGITDQFLPAFVVSEQDAPVGTVNDGDSVLLFNFRGDRAIELSRAFEQDEFVHFDRVRRPEVLYAAMMEYDGDLHIPKRFLVSPPEIDRTLGQYLSHNDVRQLAAAETQKYGHVTYFWNGNCNGLYDPEQGRYLEQAAVEDQQPLYTAQLRSSPLETFVEIRSDVVAFELRPWMKAAEVTDAVIDRLHADKPRFARVNFANGDMVGHTGDLQATTVAVSVVDASIGRLLEAVRELDGLALITADHGNADEMLMTDKKGAFVSDDGGRLKPKTSHTLNPVPLILYDPREDGKLSLRDDPQAGLSNVAATVLELLGFCPPDDYDGSLLERCD